MNETIQLERLYEMGIGELWSILQQLKEEHGINEKEYKQIKGEDNIPIYWITEEWYSIYPATKTVIIEGIGKVKINEFMDEIEKRKALIRKYIIENTQEEEIISPR